MNFKKKFNLTLILKILLQNFDLFTILQKSDFITQQKIFLQLLTILVNFCRTDEDLKINRN